MWLKRSGWKELPENGWKWMNVLHHLVHVVHVVHGGAPCNSDAVFCLIFHLRKSCRTWRMPRMRTMLCGCRSGDHWWLCWWWVWWWWWCFIRDRDARETWEAREAMDDREARDDREPNREVLTERTSSPTEVRHCYLRKELLMLWWTTSGSEHTPSTSSNYVKAYPLSQASLFSFQTISMQVAGSGSALSQVSARATKTKRWAIAMHYVTYERKNDFFVFIRGYIGQEIGWG